MNLLQLFNPLKWALAQTLVNLSKGSNSHFSEVSNQISETKVQLMAVCGLDPAKAKVEEVNRLTSETKRLKSLLSFYEQEIEKLKREKDKLHLQSQPDPKTDKL